MVWNYDASGASLETGGVYKRERRSRVSYVAACGNTSNFFKFGFSCKEWGKKNIQETGEIQFSKKYMGYGIWDIFQATG